MDEPKSLDSLFKEKIFRIPDYQRGYAWQDDQLEAFWEDLVNLASERSHYTGVLTLKEIPNKKIKENDKEYWLVEDHSYKVYHIVDGQQRLTTFIVFIQAFIEFVKGLPENAGQSEVDIYLTETQNVENVKSRFLFKVKPTGDRFRTYKFGYTRDNPSYDYLRHRILSEEGAGTVEETFYTLNLYKAKTYFKEKLKEMYKVEGLSGLQEVYKKLTKRFLFNEYVIKDEFDVFVAFETMNNRGKKLSDLELLKNRLIYLTTLYTDDELDVSDRRSLRETINDAWKEVYRQLGRNKASPLNDDDFLRAHWILYFKYSRQDGRDYIRFLLDQQFTPQRVHKKLEREVKFENSKELRDGETDEWEESEPNDFDEDQTIMREEAELKPTEIKHYVQSLKECAVHWFDSWFPLKSNSLDQQEQIWINRLNRVGMTYFRPLLMALLKSKSTGDERIEVIKLIERYIFIVFRINNERSNYGSSEFYRIVRDFDRGKHNITYIKQRLNDLMAYAFDENSKVFKTNTFLAQCEKRLVRGGYYRWPALRYFLFEYENYLFDESRQNKVFWDDLTKNDRDKVSIEHIFPETPSGDWETDFAKVSRDRWPNYQGSLGNLLILSMSINASLQNDDFSDKKKPRFSPNGQKLRNGYSDGSHSEIEVSANATWGPDEILKRGLKLLSFMEKRWDINFGTDELRKKLLLLNFSETYDGE